MRTARVAGRHASLRAASRPYPPIADYALIGDCHSSALVSRAGSIDWCCLPRFDSDSCFGRLLDWKEGGYFAITPRCSARVTREYLAATLILVTTFRSGRDEARLIDFFAMRRGGRLNPRRELVRIIEGMRGRMELEVVFAPRLDFGEVKPWVYRSGPKSHLAVGSNTALRISTDVPLEIVQEHDLRATVHVRAGRRLHIGVESFAAEESQSPGRRELTGARLNAHFHETVRWWRKWAKKITRGGGPGVNVVRSAIALKALTYAPSGAIVAAPTTSLPESVGAERNWDYRYCWIRDSIFTVWALANCGAEAEADGVRRFIQRSAAGNADELQVLYAVDGKRRLTEIAVTHLDGWRGSRPVRIGNAAERQFQSDLYGLIVELSYRWSERGHRPNAPYWAFLCKIIEAALARWQLPDRGIWEVRSRPLHFVNSKVMCWAAVSRGVLLAERYSLPAPLDRWRKARDEMRAAIEARGVDRRRNVFVRSFGGRDVDAALLLLPAVGFVPYDDERMLRTTDVIMRELTQDGLVLRYLGKDGLRGAEGVFLACTFWLAECLARQGRRQLAQTTFDRACACANDVGLFSEQYAPRARQMLGNFPQGLTHLAHLTAELALKDARSAEPADSAGRRLRAARRPTRSRPRG